MHLDKLIDLYEKNASMYANHIEIATLEHLLRLRYLEGLPPREKRKPLVLSLIALAGEIDANLSTLRNLIDNDPDAPKNVDSPDGKRKHFKYYVRDEFYAWWNNRKKK